MGFEIALLTGATIALSVTLAYAWWVKIRVLRLREDMFGIRDELFDEVLAAGAVDDPAYREAREYLNGLIRGAPAISVPAFAYVLMSHCPPTKQLVKSARQDVQALVDRSMNAAIRRVRMYLVNETVTGGILWLIMWIMPSYVDTCREADQQVERLLKPGLAERVCNV